MPKIRFLFNPKIPNDKVREWKGYLKDSVHDVSEDEANRWLRRGNVEILPSVEQVNIERVVEEKQEEELVKEVKIENEEQISDLEIKKEEEELEQLKITPPSSPSISRSHLSRRR